MSRALCIHLGCSCTVNGDTGTWKEGALISRALGGLALLITTTDSQEGGRKGTTVTPVILSHVDAED